jgi:ferredoxin
MGNAQPKTFSDLLSPLELEELETSREGVYGLWPDLTLAYVNPAWRGFVEHHEAALALARHWRLGASVLEAVDPELRPFYDRILRASLAKGRRWSHDFDCSGRCKACRYRIEVRPLPAARGLLVVHSALIECPHAFAPCCISVDARESYEDDTGLVVQCVYCRRVRSQADPGRWDLVAEWVERTPEHASGGLCDTCAGLHFPGLVPERGPRSTTNAR